MKDNSGTSGKNQDDENTRTNTSPTHTKMPMTPTKNHPLMDLVHAKEPKGGEFMDSDDSDEVMIVVEGGEKDDAVVDCNENVKNFHDEDNDVVNVENNFIENSQISTQSTEAESHQHTNNVEDEKNNNVREELNESDDEQQRLTVDKVMRRKKSPSRVNNNNNIRNNNNRMSYPISRDRSQSSEVTTAMTKSSDKIDGKEVN